MPEKSGFNNILLPNKAPQSNHPTGKSLIMTWCSHAVRDQQPGTRRTLVKGLHEVEGSCSRRQWQCHMNQSRWRWLDSMCSYSWYLNIHGCSFPNCSWWEKNGEVWSLQWSKHIWQHVETQNVNLQFCGNTKCHSGKLWKHKMSMMTLWTFCVSTKFHYAILCFHKMAMWIFVETQTAQILYLIRRVSEGGTLAKFFSDHMEKQLSFSDQTWIS